jgi:hypothetical protein
MAGLYINAWTNISGMCLDANHQLFTHGLQGGFQSLVSLWARASA